MFRARLSCTDPSHATLTSPPGLAPTRNLEGREFYAAVSLLDSGDQVTLRPASAPVAVPQLQLAEITDNSSPLRFMRQKPVRALLCMRVYCACVYACVCVYVCMCLYVCVYVVMCVCGYVCVCVCMCMC